MYSLISFIYSFFFEIFLDLVVDRLTMLWNDLVRLASVISSEPPFRQVNNPTGINNFIRKPNYTPTKYY